MPPGAFEAPDGSTIPMHGGDNETLGDFCKIGIVTVSDRASQGRYRDISGLCILEVRLRTHPYQAHNKSLQYSPLMYLVYLSCYRPSDLCVRCPTSAHNAPTGTRYFLCSTVLLHAPRHDPSAISNCMLPILQRLRGGAGCVLRRHD